MLTLTLFLFLEVVTFFSMLWDVIKRQESEILSDKQSFYPIFTFSYAYIFVFDLKMFAPITLERHLTKSLRIIKIFLPVNNYRMR